MFLPDPACRAHMIMPVITTIDYRAACFCHHKMVDIGHVCSVCLSSKCVCACVFLYVHVCFCMYVCVCLYLFVFVHMCLCVCVHLICVVYVCTLCVHCVL